MTLSLRPANEEDWSAIAALMRAASLPLDGARAHLHNFLVGKMDRTIVCAGGMEVYGSQALLRSVVVAEECRGVGFGAALTGALMARASALGVTRIFLLTTTAAAYFGSLGFVPASGDEVPPALRQSRQFQGACPASAALLSAQTRP
jgi:amino-acid N-acetyltransferase